MVFWPFISLRVSVGMHKLLHTHSAADSIFLRGTQICSTATMRVGISKSSKVAQAKTGWARLFQLNAPRDDWI